MWSGAVSVDGANVRSKPSLRSAPVGNLPLGTPVTVQAWVVGDHVAVDDDGWARIGDQAYMHSSVLRAGPVLAVPPAPANAAVESGRWIDLNLTHQVAVAYEDDVPVHVARVSTGRPGWETPPGQYRIQRRVANETMRSSSLPGQEGTLANYEVKDVRWTQYFSSDGKALHENYWSAKDRFGVPSSHGCAGMTAEDARFFWDWASVGTPIYAHF